MLALHNECLTRRYLLGRLDFLEGLLGFGLGVGRTLEGLYKLRRLRLVVMLHRAELFAELLELLLYLSHPSILLLSLGALRIRIGFGRTMLPSGPPLWSRSLSKAMMLFLSITNFLSSI